MDYATIAIIVIAVSFMGALIYTTKLLVNID